MRSQLTFFARRALYIFMLLAMSVFTSAAEWQQQVVPMVGVINYMREACIKFTAGDTVQYRFESAHEVNFDIHYHPDSGTQFKERKDAVMQVAGEFNSEKTQPYCFTWKNKHELDKEWNITLQYVVVPK
jgi:hypothetical protein